MSQFKNTITATSNRSKQENLAWLSALIVHSMLLVFFFLYHLNIVNDKPVEEFAGVSVIFGDENGGLEDETIGSEALLNSAESEPQAANTTTGKEDEPTLVTKDATVVVKKNNEVKKTETKPNTNSSNTKPTNTSASSTQKSNEEELNKKKSQFGNLFGKGSGNGGEQGNQGSTKGDPNGQVLSGISKGTGRVGGGLSNRNIVNAPTVSESSQKYGKVVVKVCVDKTGKVVEANFTQKGSTTTDAQLVAISEKAAKKYVFAPGELEQQCGTVTFDYKLN